MTIVVFGGTGFLGRRIVARLARAGTPVRVAARRPVSDLPPPVAFVPADVRDEGSVAAAVAGARGAVNAVGLYVERGGETFEAVHVRGAGCVARAARAAGLEALAHVSGIGADAAVPSAYVRARAGGERAVRAGFPGACLLRPSVVYGPGDAFLRALDDITRLAPVVPLFGRGDTRLQPVFVDDVAEAAARALAAADAAGRTLELGGPDVVTYRDVVLQVLRHRRRHRPLVAVPFAAWAVLARALALLPSPPLTRDQLVLMRRDNTVEPARDGFAALGIAPRRLEECLAASLGDDAPRRPAARPGQ